MRKIEVGTFLTLDGVMQAPGDPKEDLSGQFKWGGWIVPHFDQSVGEATGKAFEEPYDLLLGRKTYDIFAAHWPKVAEDARAAGADDGDAALAKTFDAVTKYVATHSPETLKWKNSQALGNDIVQRLKELKNSEGPRLLVQGSSELVQTLLAHDLVDKLHLQFYPIVLGNGKRLFGPESLPLAFKMERSFVSEGGVIVATYNRAGTVQTGKF